MRRNEKGIYKRALLSLFYLMAFLREGHGIKPKKYTLQYYENNVIFFTWHYTLD